MGVAEFDAWCEATEEQGQARSGPESWEGYEQDEFWQAAHRRR